MSEQPPNDPSDHRPPEARAFEEPSQTKFARDAHHTGVNLPLLFSGTRLIAAPMLLGLAWLGMHWWFFGLFLFLTFTDWVDGKLARFLHQKSTLGAYVDSFADLSMYICTVIGMWWLHDELLGPQLGWVIATAASYGLHVLVALIKFRRVPSYHSWGAQVGWFTVMVSVIAIMTMQWVWPIWIACAVVILTNLDGVLITLLLPRSKPDVGSSLEVWWQRKNSPEARG